MTSGKYRIKVRDEAYDRMYDHFKFIARVSLNAAEQLYSALAEALDSLEVSPQRCSIYIPKMPVIAELRYKLFYKRYRIVFEIIGNTVYVYDIQDCRQNTDKNIV